MNQHHRNVQTSHVITNNYSVATIKKRLLHKNKVWLIRWSDQFDQMLNWSQYTHHIHLTLPVSWIRNRLHKRRKICYCGSLNKTILKRRYVCFKFIIQIIVEDHFKNFVKIENDRYKSIIINNSRIPDLNTQFEVFRKEKSSKTLQLH